MQNTKNCNWLQVIKPRTLVKQKKTICLTPLEDAENEEWPEWRVDQIGVVIPTSRDQVGICVMTPNDFGICFFDEVKRIC
jgi:hypothetical protein